MYLFVYGTLKRSFSNHYLMKEFEYRRDVSLFDYAMYSCGSFPCIVPKAGSAVHGELYYLKDNHPLPLIRLDRLEGTPHMYKRNEVVVKFIHHEEGVVKYNADVYVWNRSLDGLKQISSGTW